MIEPTALEQDTDALRATFDILQEEAAECIMAAAKAIRFGITDEWDGQTNRQKLETEIGDLLCIISILVDNKVLGREAIELARFKKFLKMEKWAPQVAQYFKGEM